MTASVGLRPPFVVRHARVTGAILLLLPIPFAITNMLSSRLVVPGDPAATADRILASESLFRLGILATLLLMVVDAVIAMVVFYPLFRPVDPLLAALMIVLNLIAVPITMLNELTRLAVLQPGTEQVGWWLDLHEDGSLIAGLLWGLWLIPYAVLVFRSGFLPRFFSVLLVIECLGWVINSVAGLLLSNPDPSLARLPELTSLVESFLPLWLLIRGIDSRRWQEHEKLAVAGEPGLVRSSS